MFKDTHLKHYVWQTWEHTDTLLSSLIETYIHLSELVHLRLCPSPNITQLLNADTNHWPCETLLCLQKAASLLAKLTQGYVRSYKSLKPTQGASAQSSSSLQDPGSGTVKRTPLKPWLPVSVFTTILYPVSTIPGQYRETEMRGISQRQ